MQSARAVLLSVAYMALHISHKQHDFQKKRILNIKCAFDFLFNIFLKYEGESNENLNIEHERYIMTSFFYVL